MSIWHSIRIWFAIVPAFLVVHLSATALFGATGLGVAQMWEFSPIQATWLQAAFVLGYIVRIPVGPFTARIASHKIVIMGGILVCAVANALFYLYANDFTSAFILRLICGAAVGAMVYPALQLVTGNDRAGGGIALGFVLLLGWSLSVYVAGEVSAINIGQAKDVLPWASFLSLGGGWNTIYVLAALAPVIWWVPAFFLLPKQRKD